MIAGLFSLSGESIMLPPVAGRLFDQAMAAQRSGQTDVAIVTLRQVLGMAPRFAWAHLILADLLDGRGESEEAIRHYRAALKADPARFEAAFNLGALHQRAGRWDEAAKYYAEVVRQRPDLVRASARLASMLANVGQLAQAEAVIRRVMAGAANDPGLLGQLAGILQKAGRPTEAAVELRRACALAPDDGQLHLYLAVALREAAQCQAALDAWKRAEALACPSPDMAVEHGRILMTQGHLAEAETVLAQAAACGHAPALVAHAHCLRFLGQFERAEASLRQVLAVNPDDADAQWNLALLLLLQGDYRQGWRLYEARRVLQRAASPVPAWTPDTPARGRTVLVSGEQGYGDTLQFLRYADQVADSGAKVVLQVQPGLATLLAQALPYPVVASGQALPRHHFHTSLLSLPHLLGTTLDSVPPIRTRLRAPSATSESWRRRLAALTGRKIGVVWSGNQSYAENFNRAIPLSCLRTLFDDLPGVSWLALQKEKCPGDSDLLGQLPQVTDLGEDLEDWSTTAAVLENLDMLITVDTGIAHLAGAMGCPVTVLLAHVPDWRWGVAAPTTPWYPTMTLLRQRSPGDWDDVCRRLLAQLG